MPIANEGTTALGDSGSPLQVKRNGEFLIAGVLSGGTTENSVFGDISWWTDSEPHRSFIDQRGGMLRPPRTQYFVALPDPQWVDS